MALISEPADISNKHALAKYFAVVAVLSRGVGGGGVLKKFFTDRLFRLLFYQGHFL